MPTVGDWKAFRPAGFDSEPTTVVEALKQARTVILDEGRWMTGQWFQNEHPGVDPEDPFCNSWAVCAEGALAIVTVGAYCCAWHPASEGGESYVEWTTNSVDTLSTVKGADGGQLRLYEEANSFLSRAGVELTGMYDEDHSPHNWNDNSDAFKRRTDVVAWFDKAIEMAEAAETAEAEESK